MSWCEPNQSIRVCVKNQVNVGLSPIQRVELLRQRSTYLSKGNEDDAPIDMVRVLEIYHPLPAKVEVT